MLYGYVAVLLVGLCLLVYCALDVVTTPRERVRRLPKPVWLAVVLLLPVMGSIAWLAAGRPLPPGGPGSGGGGTAVRPWPSGPPAGTGPDDDEAFLRRLRERAEEQRRAGRRQEEPPAT